MLRYRLLLLLFLFPALLWAQNPSSFDANAERACQLIESERFDEAKRITDQLLRQATNVSDASALTDIGIAFEDKGRYNEAEPFHRRALEINERQYGENHPGTVPALTNLAINYKERGRYAEAEPLYKQALEIATRTDSFHAALLMNNLAFLYQEQYRYVEAEGLYQKALNIHKARTGGKDDEYMASPLQNLARLYYFQSREAEPLEKQKLLREAEKLAERALKIDEQSDPDHPETGASLNMLAAIYSDLKNYNKAEPLFERSLTVYEKAGRKNHPWTAECMHDLATLYERQGRYQEAEPLRNHTIDMYLNSGAEPHLGQDWYKNLAALYKNTNRPEKAVANLKEAMKLAMKVHEHASGGYMQRTHAFTQYYGIFERMVDWQYELGDMNEAYLAMEGSRARTLLDIMMANGIDFLTGASEETARKLRAAEEAASSDVKVAEQAEQPKALVAARKKHDDAMEAILAENQAFQSMKTIAFETVRQMLAAEKTLALEYFIGDEKSYLLLYGLDTEPKLLPLELDENQANLFNVEKGYLTAKKLMSLLQNGKDGVLDIIGNPRNTIVTGVPDVKTLEKLAALWTILIPDAQIRTRIIDRRVLDKLLILPDSALARFPFEALVVEQDAVNPHYLLDVGPATVYSPSASMYYHLKMRKIEPGKPHVLTLANPNYRRNRHSAPQDVLSERCSDLRGAHFDVRDPLPGTEEEMQRIIESCKINDIEFKGFNFDDSTEENVRKNVAGKIIVHLACHGRVVEDSNYCALELTVADRNNTKDDGNLELPEMFDLKLKSCELAILSACVTNIGLQQRGEGTWSMGRGMLASGAKRVVTTNWNVSDDLSPFLIEFFIKEINEPIGRSEVPEYAMALRQAKREIRSGFNLEGKERPELRHPYYWAPFVLIGPN